MKKVILLLVGLIGSGLLIFLCLLWKDLNLFPFDKIKLTPKGSSTFYKDRFGNYYYGYIQFGMVYRKLDTEIASFEVINEAYAKDKTGVFFRYEKIIDADAASFEFIPEKYSFVLNSKRIYEEINEQNKNNDQNREGCFAKDKNYVYFNEIKIRPNRYKAIRNIATNIVIADSEIFVGDINTSPGYNVISYPKLDISSFRPYTEFFWADKNTIYCLNQINNNFYPLSDIDRTKFRYFETKPSNQFAHVFGDGVVFYTYNGDCLRTEL
jgi:hypothetical protein